MFHKFPTRRVSGLLLSGALLALSFGPVGQVASALCADPRGNSYCTNGGLVNAQNPNPPTNVDVQNPDAGNSNVQNPNAPIAIAGVQNPDAGNSNMQNPNAPIAIAGGSQPALRAERGRRAR
jgi:hypothetical protein